MSECTFTDPRSLIDAEAEPPTPSRPAARYPVVPRACAVQSRFCCTSGLSVGAKC